MSLRTPASIFTRDAILGLQRLNERISILQNQISTGSRLVAPSDDPAGAALVVDLRASIGANTQYLKQITEAGGFLQDTEQMISNLTEGMLRLGELGVRAQDPTLSASARAALGAEIDGIRTNFISFANTKSEGKYLFAGTQTQTLPFSGPSAGPIVYAGDSNSISVDVSQNRSVTTNVPGDTLFLGPGGQGSATDLFQQVTDFRDAVLTNNLPAIQTALTNLDSILTRVGVIVTDVGGRQNSIAQLSDSLGTFNLTLQGIQNSVEDLDYPKAITDFSTTQIAQSATLSTLSKVNSKNLFDFLG